MADEDPVDRPAPDQDPSCGWVDGQLPAILRFIAVVAVIAMCLIMAASIVAVRT